MNDYLTKIELDQSKMENVYYNIEQIYKKLMNLDEEKDKVKYLALSCIYGAFLGDSMGSFCEFTLPSPNNHDYIYSSNDGIFQKGEVTDDSEWQYQRHLHIWI